MASMADIEAHHASMADSAIPHLVTSDEAPQPECPNVQFPGQVSESTAVASKGLVPPKTPQGNPKTMETPTSEKDSLLHDLAFHESRSSQELKMAHKRTTGLFGFANTEKIKQNVRDQQLNKSYVPYSVYDKYYKTGIFQKIAKNEIFENFTLGVIVANAFWMTFDTDGNTADTINDADTVYIVGDCVFFGYFSIELFIRFMAFEKKFDCCRDPWFVFDSALVTLYAFDPFVIGIITAAAGGSGLDLPTSILRLLRLARLSRLVRMLRSLPELMVMIKGMLSAATSVGYTLGLLMIITYVFGIAFCNVVPDGHDCAEDICEDGYDSSIQKIYFSSVPEAMHNLVIYAVFLDNLSNIALDCKAQSPICLILLWLYIALAALTVLNMLIGVLCEVIQSVAEDEKETLMVESVKEKFGKIAQQLDENNDQLLSWDEFKVIVSDEQALRTLRAVNVDPECLIDVAEDFFNEDGKKVFVEFEEFMSMVLDLRAGQSATIKDVLSTGKSFTGKFQKANDHMKNITQKVTQVEELLVKLTATPKAKAKAKAKATTKDQD